MAADSKSHSTPRADVLAEEYRGTYLWAQLDKARARIAELEEQLEALQETLALTYGKLAHQMDEDLLARYDEQLPRPARIGDLFVSNPAKRPDPQFEYDQRMAGVPDE